MSDIYLVGGTTPRTDLDNYLSANISKENAIKSLEYWEKEQGEYDDFHIDRIEIDDLAEHDAEIIDEFAKLLIDNLRDFGEGQNVIMAIDRWSISRLAKKMKEQKPECSKALEEHDKQIRKEAIDELTKALCEYNLGNRAYTSEELQSIWTDIKDIAEKVKDNTLEEETEEEDKSDSWLSDGRL